MMQAPKKRLGRGLAALIGDDGSDDTISQDTRGLRNIPIDLLHPNRNNPRKHFEEQDLEDLTRSIREKGVLQPLVVRTLPNGDFEIVAGERRWRAAQRAGVHEIPALIRELTDGESLEIALIENIQRSDLNPLEEARAYAQLLEQFTYTQQQLAESIGKSRSHIANTLRLLTLPDTVRHHIESGSLTAGHARTLITAESPAELADQIIRLGLSVREAENLTRKPEDTKHRPAKAEKSADTKALEKSLAEMIGLKVEINDRGRTGGTVVISYKTLEQLEDICGRLQN